MRELSELVEAAQAGDNEAYDALIQRFQQMAYATAYTYLRDHHLAQDLVQEAVIEAFIHLPQLQEPAAFPGWFRQIVFRQCARMLRKTGGQYTSLEAVSDSLLAESNPEDIAVRGEVQASVRSAIAALPPHERLVTVLFYGYRYSYNEMSTFLKVPLTTVKKRLYSARQKLKVQLQADLHDTIENARRASEDVEGAEIRLAQWWHWLILRVKDKPQQGDDAMSDELDPECSLRALVEQLGAGDWRLVWEAETALADAGQAGISAVLWGLSHSNARVRRGCAGFMDHHGTDACFAPLQQVALYDPASSVRRVAVHSATCQRCKPSPLTGDLVGLLVQAALLDTSRRVRQNAIGGLRHLPQDARAVAALEAILRTETDPRLRSDAHHALKRQNPNYRALVDTQARERGITAGQARREQRRLRRSGEAQ